MIIDTETALLIVGLVVMTALCIFALTGVRRC